MRFLCLVYFEPQTLAALSPGEKAALDRNVSEAPLPQDFYLT